MSQGDEHEEFEGDDRQYSSPDSRVGWSSSTAPAASSRNGCRPRRYSRCRHGISCGTTIGVRSGTPTSGRSRRPQLLSLHDDLAEIVDSNRQDGDKAKPAALVDAYPGLGKSTAVCEFGRGYYLEQIALRGETTPDGHHRVPLIYIDLTGNTRIRGLNAAICRRSDPRPAATLR